MQNRSENRVSLSFRVVHSLNKKETAFLKKELSPTDVLKALLNVILAQKHFHPQALFQSMKEKGYTKRQTRDAGNALFFHVFRVKRYYEKLPGEDVYHLLEIIAFLEKEHLDETLTPFIERAKLKAQDQELLELEVQLIRKEIEIAQRRPDFKLMEIQRKNEEISIALSKLQNLLEFYKLYEKALYLVERKWELESPKYYSPQEEVFNHPLLASEEMAITDSAKAVYWNINQILFRYKGENEAFLNATGALISLHQASPFLQKKYPEVHIKNLYFAALIAAEKKEKALFNQYIEAIESINPSNSKLKATQIFRISFPKIVFAWETKDVLMGKEVVDFVHDAKDLIDTISPSQRGRLYFAISNFCLGIGEGKKALFFINKTLEVPSHSLSKPIEIICRVMQILALLKRQNDEIAFARLDALQKFLRRGKHTPQSWSALRKFLRTSCSCYNHKERKILYSEFREKIMRTGLDLSFLEPFNLPLFLQAESQGKTMLEI